MFCAFMLNHDQTHITHTDACVTLRVYFYISIQSGE